MALKDVAGIFSRAFVVGYFIPAFAALLVVDLSVDTRALPEAYNALKAGTQLLVVGGVALMLGLLLWGLHYPILRLFQGYGLEAASVARVPRLRLWPTQLRIGGWRLKPFPWLYDKALERQKAKFNVHATAAASTASSTARSAAIKEINRAWPPTEGDVLASRLGNVVRSFEWHPRPRYNLNGIYAYPRIATMLNEAEREIVTDARTDVAFFLNIAFLSVLVGAYVIVDSLWHGWWDSPDLILAVLLPPIVYVSAYRAAVGAADRWGAAVRTSFDLHRLDLYDQMGLKRPQTQEEEQEIAGALNRLLVYAVHVPDGLRKPPEETDEDKEDSSDGPS